MKKIILTITAGIIMASLYVQANPPATYVLNAGEQMNLRDGSVVVCSAKRPRGEICQSNDQCASNICYVTGTDSTMRCW